MDFMYFEVFFIIIILYIEGSTANRRTKRDSLFPSLYPSGVQLLSPSSFETIINSSIPVVCSNNGRKRSISLNPASLHDKLVQEGGVMIPHLMASEDESSEGFKNLLNLGTFPIEEEIDHHFTSTESPLYKHKLEEDLKKWSSIINIIKSANKSKSANSNFGNNSVASGVTTLGSSLDSTSSVQRKISNFLVQNQISLDQLKYYVNSMGITTNPKILMSLERGRNKRKRRDSSGSTTTVQYCILKGAPIAENSDLRKLCSECGATTILPPDTFPRTINEVLCRKGGSEASCLTVDSIAHGECHQETLTEKFLRREQIHCRIDTKTEEEIMVQQWKPYFQKIRNGCICSIDKHSQIYAHMEKPVFG